MSYSAKLRTYKSRISKSIKKKARQTNSNYKWLLLPALLYLVVFLLIPFAIVLYFSVIPNVQPGELFAGGLSDLTTINYINSFTDSLAVDIMLYSLRIGIIVTMVSLILSFPMAYHIAFNIKKYKRLMLVLTIIPFWINIVIRGYSWRLMLSENGLINWMLVDIVGMSQQPVVSLNTEYAVIIGLIHVFIPFMLLPLYTTLNNIDKKEVEAAKSLGANKAQAFYQIVLPQSLPGVVAGVSLTFVLAFTSYLIPILLGGAGHIMIANYIARMYTDYANWTMGSALAVTVTAISLSIILILNRFANLSNIYGVDS